MEIITIVYITNATLLLLHEIESAYEKEWEILKLPGKITGFIIIHFPIILILFYGALEIEKYSNIGLILGIISGIGGIIPFLIHKIIVKQKEHFNIIISNILIYFNILTGIGLLILSAQFFV